MIRHLHLRSITGSLSRGKFYLDSGLNTPLKLFPGIEVRFL